MQKTIAIFYTCPLLKKQQQTQNIEILIVDCKSSNCWWIRCQHVKQDFSCVPPKGCILHATGKHPGGMV